MMTLHPMTPTVSSRLRPMGYRGSSLLIALMAHTHHTASLGPLSCCNQNRTHFRTEWWHVKRASPVAEVQKNLRREVHSRIRH